MENINVKVINQNNVDIKVTPQVSNVVEVVTPQPFSIKIDKGTVGPQGPQGPQGETGEGVPTGGTTGQALVKTSDADYDTEWSNTVPNAINADNATYATSAGSALTADEANHAISADLATNAIHATTADSATLAGNVTGIVAVANGGTGADNADSARSNLSAAKSGANSDITSLSGITGGISTADFVQFDTAYATTLGVGQIGWDGNNTLGLGMAGGNVVQKIGEDFFYYVKASSAISKGQLCMFTGSVGASGVVTAAPATGVTNGQYIMGVAAEAISHNAFGLVQVFGTLRNVDTSAFDDGDVLYYNSAVTGGFTTTFPASGPIVTCAAVVKGGSSGGGVLQVRVAVTQRMTAGSGITVTQDGSGTTISNASPSTGGTVTSVDTAGTVNGLTLTGGPITSSGTITLGGTLDLSSPPAIGGTTPAAGTFTTLTATGQTNLGGSSTAPSFRATVGDNAPNTMWVEAKGASSSDSAVYLGVGGTPSKPLIIANSANSISFRTTTIGGTANQQFNVAHTASAVNYVQVTGAATGGQTLITAQGSDANIDLGIKAKGSYDTYVGNANGWGLRARGSSASGNYFQVAGSNASASPVFSVIGGDTNISQVFQSKGTGAIDLAAGSSGVNISNGGTVTAITQTNAGSGYTSVPTVAISAPTTAGGVQATMSITMSHLSASTISNGGTGYTVNDVLTIVGGTTGTAAQFTVTSVSGGVVTGITRTGTSTYTVLPSSPSATTGGTGTGCTIAVNWAVNSAFTITNAGSGYVEQPTVSFSGGGGSGAAAYATVGSAVTVKSLGGQLNFLAANSGTGLRVADSGGGQGASGGFWTFTQNFSTSAVMYASATGVISSGSTNPLSFFTNTLSQEQFRVAHTASAVNYVQVTGAATGNAAGPTISAQGSDSNVPLSLQSKLSAPINFFTSGGYQQFKINNVSTAVNYLQAAGNATGLGVQFSAQGSDTNISQVFQSKGTGAIDLAAGSSGVNISNGGTVTAITRTAVGGSYTTNPSVVISAPTTAGGVQATATIALNLNGIPTIVSGGTGYTVNDVLTISGGTSTIAAQLTVTSVSAGVITAVSVTNGGSYTVAPSNNISVSGGTGTGATFTANWGIRSDFTITNAGSGYVEQPTVSFSGGGGSGAAAYATVGSNTIIKSLAGGSATSGLYFHNASGSGLAVVDGLTSSPSTLYVRNSSNSQIYPSSGSLVVSSGSGSNSISFYTNAVAQEQLRVAHTASAVNYVQVTGAATGNAATISAQGSDTAVGLSLVSKGSSNIGFYTNSASSGLQFIVLNAASVANRLTVTGSATGVSPVLGVNGSDTNIDLALTPKGTGRVKFGTYTASILTPTGYVEIVDSGGTVRRLLVG